MSYSISHTYASNSKLQILLSLEFNVMQSYANLDITKKKKLSFTEILPSIRPKYLNFQ